MLWTIVKYALGGLVALWAIAEYQSSSEWKQSFLGLLVVLMYFFYTSESNAERRHKEVLSHLEYLSQQLGSR